MARRKIGVVLESLGKPLRTVLPLVAKVGVQGVQFDGAGDFHPDKLSQTGRREVRHLITMHQLEMAALYCPLRYSLDTQENYEGRIQYVKKVMQLAYDLGTRVTIVAAGEIPSDTQSDAYTLLRNSLWELGRYGDRIGVRLAVEAGYEPAELLKTVLSGMDTGGLAVNIDPATAVLQRHNPVQLVRELASWVAHVHARDAHPGRAERAGNEVLLGAGQVEWTSFLSVLEEIGYRSWLTIKRHITPDPVADLQQAVAFLRTLGV
jgi:sugar phosphate isomerase/epimerase